MPRQSLKYLVDVLLWWSLTPLAFLLRLEERVVDFLPEITFVMIVALPVKAGLVYVLGWYRRSWQRTGVRDLYSLVLGITVVSVLFVLLRQVAPSAYVLPRSVPLIEGMLAILALGGVRLATRLSSERYRALTRGVVGKARRVAIVGAGEAGVMVTREMLRHPEAGRTPVGFLDDDPSKWRNSYAGVKVIGPIEALPEMVDRHAIDEVLIAMPSQRGDAVRRVVELAREARVEHRIIPALHDLVSGNVSIAEIREVDVQDLLRREPVELDTAGISRFIRGRTVLITGAGGSIGAEVARQVAAYRPGRLLLLGRGENSIFDIDRELAHAFPALPREAIIADVRDRGSLRAFFARHRPEVVFHAAAHKHVPLMEAHPEQAVFNNVVGTRNAVELALEHGACCFVNLSSDKAVNPSSVMGATKRVSEMIVHDAALRVGPGCAYVSVRFGNVLGSRGSVIPLFREQIRRGGPVTVTHPDMKRYFMTIPEATQLVLQAASMGLNGAVCVLDMGEPVRIEELARDLILLCGKQLDREVSIAYTGMRPGEKLFEELLMAEEGTIPSRHQKIFTARSVNGHGPRLHELLDRLIAAAEARDGAAIRRALAALVPTCTFAAAGPMPPDGQGDGGVERLAGAHA